MGKFQSQHTGQKIDKGVKLALLRQDLTQEEYDALKRAGNLVGGTTYRIYRDQNKTELVAIYDGATLIGPADLSHVQTFEDLNPEEYNDRLRRGQIQPGILYKIFRDQSKSELVAVYFGKEKILPQDKDGLLTCADMTQVEYDALKRSGAVMAGTLYRIYGDSSKKYLMALYDGNTLIAQRGTSGNKNFPYTWPITF